jgi:formate hydrogenlyase transcriptional activator
VFRSDLYYRLSIFPITLPSLRERREDIPMLVRHFVKELSKKAGKNIDSVAHEAMAALKSYPWPGNIRELRNVIERAVIVTSGHTLRLFDSLGSAPEDAKAAAEAQTSVGEVLRGETLEQSQYNLILNTLKKCYWRIEGPYSASSKG